MFVKTYEDEYRDCQKSFLKLVRDNTRLKSEIERKDEAIKTVLRIEPRFGEPLQPYFDAIKEVLRQALQNKE